MANFDLVPTFWRLHWSRAHSYRQKYLLSSWWESHGKPVDVQWVDGCAATGGNGPQVHIRLLSEQDTSHSEHIMHHSKYIQVLETGNQWKMMLKGQNTSMGSVTWQETGGWPVTKRNHDSMTWTLPKTPVWIICNSLWAAAASRAGGRKALTLKSCDKAWLSMVTTRSVLC